MVATTMTIREAENWCDATMPIEELLEMKCLCMGGI